MIVFDNKKQPYEKCGLYPSVAQLDNATDSDSGEWGFKSLRVGQKIKDTIVVVPFVFCNTKKPRGFEADRKENSPVDCF